ncbi:MAG: hypothetical protein V1934_09165 [Methanobacteriota archaeon]
MNKETKLVLIIVAMIAVAGAVGFASSSVLIKPPEHFVPPDFNPEQPPPNRIDPADRDSFINAKSALTMINMVLSVALIALYVKIYGETKAQFTMGLISVMLALFLYALMSNPMIPMLFGYRIFGVGLFSIMPDIFTTVALSILIYLTVK